MAKKSKKRQLEADSNENEKIGTKSHVNNDARNKKKFKISSDKSEKNDESSVAGKPNDLKNKDVNVSTTVAGGEKLKKNKNKKFKKQEKLENSADNKNTPPDSKNNEISKLRRQEVFKKKRAEFKEKRKLLGPKRTYAISDKLSLKDMKKRIADIESRETISKTAIRKLRILKKKVQIAESGDSEKTVNQKDSTSDNVSKENKKNKLHKKKKEKPVVKSVEEKNLFIVDRVGSAVDDSSNSSNEEENESNIKKSKKNMKNLKNKITGNPNIKNNENDSDSEEDGDEDTDECENDSEEETNELDETVNDSDSEESKEDSNEDESKLKKVEKAKTAPVAKIKNTQNKSNEDSSKPKSKPTEKDPNKKQRYVLFVGNIGYDASTVDVKKHFLKKVEIVKDVRIPLDQGTNKPRGFAYVEVENSEDYEKALSLHNTFINGRQIKVEYTTSGSKKSSRKPEVIHKNKKLHALRKEGKLAGSKKFSHKRSFRRNFKNNPKKKFGKGES